MRTPLQLISLKFCEISQNNNSEEDLFVYGKKILLLEKVLYKLYDWDFNTINWSIWFLQNLKMIGVHNKK